MSDYGFCINPKTVRIDLYKESMKWSETLELNFDRYNAKIDNEYENIIDTFKRCVAQQYPNKKEYYVICLDPCHEHSHPLMIKI